MALNLKICIFVAVAATRFPFEIVYSIVPSIIVKHFCLLMARIPTTDDDSDDDDYTDNVDDNDDDGDCDQKKKKDIQSERENNKKKKERNSSRNPVAVSKSHHISKPEKK